MNSSEFGNIILPPSIERNLFKAVNTLVTGIVNIPGAWLDSKAQAIKDETAAKSAFTNEAVKAAAKQFSSEDELIKRAIAHFGSRIFKEQKNREAVARITLKEFNSKTVKKDTTKEIDEDWLDFFSRVAEKRSNRDIQIYLAKLLAGEIKNPGTFDPATIELLAKLTPDSAKTFQKFCNISMVISKTNGSQTYLDHNQPFIFVEPYGKPGENSLSELGFSYTTLTKLQDIGLIQSDLDAWKEMCGLIFALPVEIGGNEFEFVEHNQLTEEDYKVSRFKIINFTTSGIQLRQIIEKTPNQQYIQKLRVWLNSVYNWE